MTRCKRTLLSKADGLQAQWVNTKLDKVVAGTDSTAFTQGKVVFVSSPFVTMTLDDDSAFQIGLEPCGIGFKLVGSFSAKRRFVEIKKEITKNGTGNCRRLGRRWWRNRHRRYSDIFFAATGTKKHHGRNYHKPYKLIYCLHLAPFFIGYCI